MFSVDPVPNYAGKMYQPQPSQMASYGRAADPRTHTTHPMVTGTSVLGLKFKDGVVLAADTLGSYGSLAMFKSIQRIRSVGRDTLVGGGGEYSDYQALMDVLDDTVIDEREHDDGATLAPKEVHSLVSQLMYQRRNRMDPYYVQVVVAGCRDGKPFLGYADLHGSNYEDNHVATGYGAYIAIPLLRKHYRPDLTRDEALRIVEDCMRVLFYRDKNTINKVQFAVADARGVEIQPPRQMKTEWENMEKASNKAVQQIVRITQPPQ